MRMRTSTPIGLTPGNLSNATKRQWLYSRRDSSVAILLALVAMAVLRFGESFSTDESKHH